MTSFCREEIISVLQQTVQAAIYVRAAVDYTGSYLYVLQ